MVRVEVHIREVGAAPTLPRTVVRHPWGRSWCGRGPVLRPASPCSYYNNEGYLLCQATTNK